MTKPKNAELEAKLRIVETTPHKVVFSVRGRKDPVYLFLWTKRQLAISVPFRSTGFSIRAAHWGTANRYAMVYQKCRAENDEAGLIKIAAVMLRRADEFRRYKRLCS